MLLLAKTNGLRRKQLLSDLPKVYTELLKFILGLTHAVRL